jgi:hypothetical protein
MVVGGLDLICEGLWVYFRGCAAVNWIAAS